MASQVRDLGVSLEKGLPRGGSQEGSARWDPGRPQASSLRETFCPGLPHCLYQWQQATGSLGLHTGYALRKRASPVGGCLQCPGSVGLRHGFCAESVPEALHFWKNRCGQWAPRHPAKRSCVSVREVRVVHVLRYRIRVNYVARVLAKELGSTWLTKLF